MNITAERIYEATVDLSWARSSYVRAHKTVNERKRAEQYVSAFRAYAKLLAEAAREET